MAKPRHTVIGVDIGGTKVTAGLLTTAVPELSGGPSGHIPPLLSARVTTATDVSSTEACLASIEACVAEVVRATGDLEAIGVGVASMVEFAAGRIVHSVNLPLNDVPLADLLRERFAVPAVVDNDANAAAIGEHCFGAGAGTSEMLMLTLGTGVGGGVICRGRPYRGFSGAGAELGHIMVDANGPPCPGACPNHGCLEAYVSGTAMGAAASAAARDKPDSALGRALAAGDAVDGRLLTRLALEGDGEALALIEGIGEQLGLGLVTLVNIFNPERIVIGGGAAATGELLFAPARRVLAERALSPQRDEVSVVPARLGPDAGMIGAASLALIELFTDKIRPLS